jgi:ribosome-associated protein
MQTIQGDAMNGMPKPEAASDDIDAEGLLREVVQLLDDAKADDVVTIELTGKSSVADYMVIASGRSDRHVGAIADQVQRRLKEIKYSQVRVEGQPQNDWVLIDVGDLIVHVFRPEVREFYNLEKMWMADTSIDGGATH